ncbi:hypothetical protein AMECASPLE_036981 [Ameca splendens]|uniref:Uncharacterized protein n=1 Tax=Ameca splendens TaxID=208324 RepID=A0ABV1A3Z1_9TELE
MNGFVTQSDKHVFSDCTVITHTYPSIDTVNEPSINNSLDNNVFSINRENFHYFNIEKTLEKHIVLLFSFNIHSFSSLSFSHAVNPKQSSPSRLHSIPLTLTNCALCRLKPPDAPEKLAKPR